MKEKCMKKSRMIEITGHIGKEKLHISKYSKEIIATRKSIVSSESVMAFSVFERNAVSSEHGCQAELNSFL